MLFILSVGRLRTRVDMHYHLKSNFMEKLSTIHLTIDELAKFELKILDFEDIFTLFIES